MADSELLHRLSRDPWAGAPALRGSMPRIPQRAELPLASEALRGCLVRIQGDSGVADGTYQCAKTAGDTYSWVQVDGGGGYPLGYVADAAVEAITVTAAESILAEPFTLTLTSSRRYKVTIMVGLSIDSGGVGYTVPLLQWLRNGTPIASKIFTVFDTNGTTITAVFQDALPAGTADYDIAAGRIIGDPLKVLDGTILIEDIGPA